MKKTLIMMIGLTILSALAFSSCTTKKTEPVDTQPESSLTEATQPEFKETEIDPSQSTKKVTIITPETTMAQSKPTPDTYPIVDGSTVTIPLSEQYAADYMGISVEEARLYVLHNKTHAAYVNLIEGEADIIFVTSPSEEELAMAESADVELEIHPVVREAFVFLVNEKNPVENLSQQQIRDIYAGKITNWSQVGGANQEIIAYQRPENSGSQTGMLSLVMGDVPLMKAPTEWYPSEMGELVDVIVAYDNAENAIGYSYYYYVSSMYFRQGIRLMAIDGVKPEPAAIQSGSYPYTTSYYAIIRKSEPSESPARKLLEWILQEGNESARKAGYVPLS